jgi:predicted phage-related endonuclease
MSVPWSFDPNPQTERNTMIPFHEQWLADRAEGIGASEAPAVLHASPFMSRRELKLLKLGLIEGFTGSPQSRLGQALEEPLFRWWLEEQRLAGKEIEGEWLGKVSIAASDWPVMRASPDGLAHTPHGDMLVEIKTTASTWGELPHHVWIQVQQQLHVMQLEKAAVVALSAGRLRTFEVNREDAFIDRLLTEEQAFWEEVLAGVTETEADEPPPRPAPEGSIIELTGAEAEIVAEIAALRESIREQEARVEALTKQLRAKADGGEALLVDRWGNPLARVQVVTSSRLDQKLLAELVPPELLEKARKTMQSTRFLVL